MLFFSDAEVRRGEIHIRSLDTTLPLTRDLANSIWRQAVMYCVISTVFWYRVATFKRAPFTLGFFPVKPKPWYKVWNITKWMGFKYSDDFAACDALFYFEDTTTGSGKAGEFDTSNKRVLNGACTDISKARVEEAFERIFGYGLGVDPTTFEGPVVQKSEINAAHDGKIIICPIEARADGTSYQRFVENCYDGEMVEDIRVPVVGGQIPLVYLKRRPAEIRFANDNTECVMVETAEALSEAEVEQIIAFAREMGLDFGGLDVLRDQSSGKIYVVDVNKTDMGPPIPLSLADKMRALTRLGRAFVDMMEAS